MKICTLPLLFVATCLAGCHTWRLAPGRLGTPVPTHERLQIWSHGQRAVVHGVQLRGDTVRAVPRLHRPECDSCAIFFPLSTIDSVRSRRFSSGRTIGLIAGAVSVAMILGNSGRKGSLPGAPQ